VAFGWVISIVTLYGPFFVEATAQQDAPRLPRRHAVCYTTVMPLLLISSARFEDHVTPPGHPERAERAHVFDAVRDRWVQKGGRVAEPRSATREELERAHTARHLDAIERTSGRAVMLDADTYTSPDSEQVARLAAGAAIQAAEHAAQSREPAFALVRPPGHHAERDRAMGFCLYNNVAVAACAALERGLPRVAIVDIDVHHGNGTQDIFYSDPRVLYVSTHQFPFYPGTGAADEAGDGAGMGFTVNVPMEAGSADDDYDLVYRTVVGPVVEQFAPALTIVSAGYDAHERDPLASMRLSTDGYARIVRRLRATAHRAGSALAFVTEGGYDLHALAACLEASFEALDEEPARMENENAALESDPSRTARGMRAVRAVSAVHARHWNL
jgi:acetoin utilization deacetylase AcuC-like enzyme